MNPGDVQRGPEAGGPAPDVQAGVARAGGGESGLTEAEVADRRATGRVNDVPVGPSRTAKDIVKANVLTRFNALLGTMLVLILVVGPIQDALFGVVLVLNSAIGIVQELRAKRTLDRLALLTAPRARIVRSGEIRELPVGEVVLDDVLEVETGSQIVVDGEVISARGLEMDESLLTGESDPVAKAPGDAVLSGSFVVAGWGRFRTTGVGGDVYAVKLAEQVRRFSVVRSELRDGVNRILAYVSFAIVPTAILLFWSQLGALDEWRRAVSGAVAGTVAMVPEGLVLLMSIAFAVAVMRLARQRVLVQELPAVEVLARVDVVCIDKTGTLTEGTVEVEDVEYLGGVVGSEVEAALGALAANDPSPNATMRAVGKRFPAPAGGWVPTTAVPFSSARKWSGMEFDGRGAWILGGPDVLVGRPAEGAAGAPADGAAAAPADGGPGATGAVPSTTSDLRRAVMLARCPSLDGDRLPGELTPVALVALGERIRADAGDTLRFFREQGVVVKVISGDDPRTVGAIAARLGLPGAEAPVDARALPGDLTGMADAVEASSVFGRVTPEQKRAMVSALRSKGHTVAMTGDGVNDALALKDADIGVAMGSGSEATRAVAKLVLLDSDFAALPRVVAEGRRVLGNIERTSMLYLNKTVYAMLLALATGVAGVAFPFLPRHLTLVASLTIGIPSFFLALAPNAQRFRPRFLRRVLRFAVPVGLLAAAATWLAYELARREPGLTLAEERTTAVITLALVGLAVLSLVARPQTGWRLALVWSMAAAFLAAFASPTAREFFALSPPPLLVWLAALGIATIVFSLARLLVPAAMAEGTPAPDKRSSTATGSRGPRRGATTRPPDDAKD